MIRGKKLHYLFLMTAALAVVCYAGVCAADDFPKIASVDMSGTEEGQFQHPYGLAVDETRSRVYVADTGSNKIRKFNLFGDYQNSFGSSGSEDRQFYHPQGVGVDKANGDIYVVDTVNHRIQKFSADGTNYTFLLKFGSSGNQPGQFYLPRDIAVDAQGNVYVCDGGNDRIVKFTSAGEFLTVIGQDEGLLDPYGIALDSPGNIYAADTEHHRIVKFAPDGSKLLEFGSYGTEAGQLCFPHDVAVDNKGNIFVADTDNYRIQKFNAQGIYLNSFGVFLDFLSAQKIVVDGNDNLYVIDSNTNKLSIYNVSTYIDNVFADPTPFTPDGDGFQDSTFIHYTIPEPAKITLTIYDEQGNLVRNLIEDAQRLTAENSEEWDGKNDSGLIAAAGVYTCKVDAVNAVNYHAPQRSCSVTVQYPAGAISGIVTDGMNAIFDAAVSDGTRSTKTDAEGRYTIENVPLGTYTVTVSKSGYNSKSQEVTLGIEGEEITGVDFILDSSTPTTSYVSGTVTDGVIPLEAVTVSDGIRSAQTGTDGKYTIEDVLGGTYTVTASKQGYKISSVGVTIVEGMPLTGVDFILEESDKPDIHVEPASLEFQIKPGEVSTSSLSSEEVDDGDSESESPKGKIIQGEYIVKFEQGVSKNTRQNVLAGAAAVLLKESKTGSAWLIRPAKISVEALKAVRKEPARLAVMEAKLVEFERAMSKLAVSQAQAVEYIEPNREVYLLDTVEFTPNDSGFADQWSAVKISAPEAWDIEAGKKSIIAAVIDSGVDYTHEDLAANYRGGGYDFVEDDHDPYPNGNGIDDDNDGFIDEGIDHGTHVAGIIGAVSNNIKGIAGIAQVSILAERALDSDGSGSSFEVADAIDHAVAQGAHIINLSIGGGGTDFEREACQNAWDKGCVIVGAAGNDYRGPVNYPAAYSTVIAVSATDAQDNIASFSNVGPKVELSAPGVSILSTVVKDGGYLTKSGTSMSTPCVAGVAALVWSVNPDLNNEQVRKILQESVVDLGAWGRDGNFGYGRIDAYKAVLRSAGLYQSQGITIYNHGGINLEVADIVNTHDWLSVERRSFSVPLAGSNGVVINVRAVDLSEGTYTDTLQIFSDDPDEGIFQIPVTVVVNSISTPIIADLPDKVLDEDTNLDDTIDLWEYTAAPETADEDLTFSIIQNTSLDCGVSIDSNRFIDINPARDWYGGSDVTIRAADTGGLYSEDTFHITIAPVNDAPAAEGQNIELEENTSMEITLIADDVDGDSLEYSISAEPSHGALSKIDGDKVTYTPEANYKGSDSFTFIANDGEYDSNEAVVNIMVHPVISNAPTAYPQSVELDEDDSLEITLAATDIDSGSLTYSIVTAPARGSLSEIEGDKVTYTPETDCYGHDSFTFIANDGVYASNEAVVTITIKPVNDAPTAAGQSVELNEDASIEITLAAADIEGESLTYKIDSAPGHGALSVIAGDKVTYTPQANYHGPDSFTFKANDGKDDSEPATVNILVKSVNDAPTAAEQSVELNEDASIEITLAAADIEGESLTYKIDTEPGHGVLSVIAGDKVTYTPQANYNGSDSFTFKANDGKDNSNIAAVSILVKPVNDAPTAAGQSVELDEDTSIEITLAATDIEGESLTYKIDAVPGHGSLSVIAGDKVTYTPQVNYNGQDSFTFKANDGKDDSAPVTVSILVKPVNDAPELALIGNKSVNENQLLEFIITAGDPDGDKLALTVSDLPSGALIKDLGTASDGWQWKFSWIPSYDQAGAYPVQLEAGDGELVDNEKVVLTVIDVDITAPRTTHNYDGAWHNKDWTIILTAQDTQSEIAAIYYRINNSSRQTVKINGQPVISVEGANNSLEYWSVDKSGNEELPHNILEGVKLDKTKPQTAIVTPVDEDSFSAGPITVSGTVSDVLSGVDSVTVDVDGTIYYAAVSGGKFSVDNVNIIGGANNITVAAQDNAGNKSQDSVTVFLGWMLHLDVPYYNIGDYYSGAASCQMILNYIRRGVTDTETGQLASELTQKEIYNYGRPFNYQENVLLNEMDAQAVDYALGHFDPYDPSDPAGEGHPAKAYNFDIGVFEPEQFTEYLRDIIHWMDYPVKKDVWWLDVELAVQPNTPAAVPVYGSYEHWVIVNGAAASQDPFREEDPFYTPDFTVYGLWLTDPAAGGIGQDLYVTPQEIQNTYFVPLASLDGHNGQYLQVAEPPQALSKAQVELAPPKVNAETVKVAAIACEIQTKDQRPNQPEAGPPLAETKPAGGWGDHLSGYEQRLKNFRKHIYDAALAVNLKEDVLAANKDLPVPEWKDELLETVFDKNKPPLELDWKKVIDGSLLADEDFREAFDNSQAREFLKVRRLDKENSFYYLIPFDKYEKGQFLTYAAVIIDSEDGSFKCASWLEEPARFIQIRKEQAVEILSAQYPQLPVNQKVPGMLGDEWAFGSGLRPTRSGEGTLKNRWDHAHALLGAPQNFESVVELVWQPGGLSSSPFYPYWRISLGNKVYFVTQDKEVIEQ